MAESGDALAVSAADDDGNDVQKCSGVDGRGLMYLGFRCYLVGACHLIGACRLVSLGQTSAVSAESVVAADAAAADASREDGLVSTISAATASNTTTASGVTPIIASIVSAAIAVAVVVVALVVSAMIVVVALVVGAMIVVVALVVGAMIVVIALVIGAMIVVVALVVGAMIVMVALVVSAMIVIVFLFGFVPFSESSVQLRRVLREDRARLVFASAFVSPVPRCVFFAAVQTAGFVQFFEPCFFVVVQEDLAFEDGMKRAVAQEATFFFVFFSATTLNARLMEALDLESGLRL